MTLLDAALLGLWLAAAAAGLSILWLRRARRRRASITAPAPAPPQVPGPKARRAASERAADPATGRPEIGPYRIERPLGRGAMGVVYLAHDRATGRPVALKALSLGDDFEGEALADARQRFFREAETARRLRHPGVVAVLRSGEADGLAYIAMEYVDGADLAGHITPKRLLPLAEVVAVVADAADALAYAHRQGVVHRDVKPANLLVDRQTGAVKVGDFGIARIADAARTRTGVLLGTPTYMAPEQMMGEHVDGRSDLYSLGVTLFQLLTGELPHRSESMAELMRQIAQSTAPDVRSLRPEVPPALARVVAHALEKRPDARYADGAVMAADLRAALREGAAPGPLPGTTAASATDVAEFMPNADSVTVDRSAELSRDEPRHNSLP